MWGAHTTNTQKTRWSEESLASAAAGASVGATDFKRGARGEGAGRGARRKSEEPQMGAAGHLVCSEPGSRGYSVGRQRLGSFCYPTAASDVQNRRTFSFSLPFSFQRGSGRPGGWLERELRRRVPRSDPRAGFRLADGAQEPCSSWCDLRGAHGGGSLSTRQSPAERKGKPARVHRLAPLGRRNPRCTPFFGGKGGGRGRRGGAGESSYLRFNCRWRLRLFQDRRSSPKN